LHGTREARAVLYLIILNNLRDLVTNLPYPVGKSKMAFQFSVEKLFAESKHVYMWTLTFKKAETDGVAMYRFNQVMAMLQYHNKLLRGLRVVERHPGETFFGDVELSHGLHFHLLLNQRVSKDWLERIGWKWGIGFTWVDEVNLQDALYCAKYLSKKDGTELQKGGRKWGAIGGFENIKVADIEINSPFHRNFRLIQRRCKVTQVTPDVLHSIYLNTEKFGPIESWPTDRIFYGGRSRELLSAEMLGFPVKDWGRNEDGSLVVDPTRKPLRYTRVNRATQKQQMERRAAIWKEKANCRLKKREFFSAPPYQAAEIKQVETEAKLSGKIFSAPGAPRGFPLY